MKTSIGICLTAVWLLLATKPIVTLSQGTLESYWFTRMNGLSMDLTKRLGRYLAAVIGMLLVAITATWLIIASMSPLERGQ